MIEKIKERAFGAVATVVTTGVTFLFVSYFNSFKTIASSDTDHLKLKSEMSNSYKEIKSELKIIKCYLDTDTCIKSK